MLSYQERNELRQRFLADTEVNLDGLLRLTDQTVSQKLENEWKTRVDKLKEELDKVKEAPTTDPKILMELINKILLLENSEFNG